MQGVSVYNLPNILTISRIAVIPFIFISVYISSYTWAMLAGILFVAASITDYFDGYLARAWNETSAFGRLLDPIADKLLVATALVVIMTKTYVVNGEVLHYYAWSGTIIAAFVILCREILVSGLREFLREVNVGLPVTKLAKWKTTFQMVALAMMLFCELSSFWKYLGEFLLWVAAVLTFITGYQYYQKSLDYVRAEEAKKVKAVKEVVAMVEKAAEEKKVKPAAKKTATSVKKTVVKKKTVKKTGTVKKTATAKKKVDA
ncbi:MAG: CDP-diacylglycerol--glycerol-3-phosphate 3-phosphatidyltransferase [Alphaproteobacteria bacterium]|nr:CDP-diacylglycerol--glycerol-3-phosphate 3-phosphatidyltransferase [Alphaproteobacteria bacterium]